MQDSATSVTSATSVYWRVLYYKSINTRFQKLCKVTGITMLNCSHTLTSSGLLLVLHVKVTCRPHRLILSPSWCLHFKDKKIIGFIRSEATSTEEQSSVHPSGAEMQMSDTRGDSCGRDVTVCHVHVFMYLCECVRFAWMRPAISPCLLVHREGYLV